MKLTIHAALAAASLFALAACNRAEAPANTAEETNVAATPAAAGAEAIDGTWKADLASVKVEQKPDTFLLKDGKYSCSTCVPKVDIAADGAFHVVSGSPYYDSASAKVVDPNTVERARKKGDKVVGESTAVVSPDGKTLTVSFKDMSVPDAPVVTGKYSETRVDAAPAGAHAISGSWQPATFDAMSDEGITTTFKRDGDTLNMSSPGGVSYAAKLDGTDAPIKGDTGGTVVSVERLSDTSYRETNKRAGKVVGVGTYTVGPDGKMQAVYEDKERNQTTRYTLVRQ